MQRSGNTFWGKLASDKGLLVPRGKTIRNWGRSFLAGGLKGGGRTDAMEMRQRAGFPRADARLCRGAGGDRAAGGRSPVEPLPAATGARRVRLGSFSS